MFRIRRKTGRKTLGECEHTDDAKHLNVLLCLYFKGHSFRNRVHYEQVNICVKFRIRSTCPDIVLVFPFLITTVTLPHKVYSPRQTDSDT